MPTFAQLLENPALLTPELRSPILHPDSTITILWEGETGGGKPFTIAEWVEGEIALHQIPGTNLWGVDLSAPPIPATVCTRFPVGWDGRAMPSARHNPILVGSATPELVGAPQAGSQLDADLTLPLGQDARRLRTFLPPGATAADSLPVLIVLDAQFFVDRNPAFPRTTDRLAEEGAIPRLLLVALDNSPTNRGGEFQAGTPENDLARRWVWEQVLPWVQERYPNAGPVWILGFSMGAGFTAQLLLGRPDQFAGGALLSPAFGDGQEAVWQLAKASEGGHRLWLSHGDFGTWEQKTLPATTELAERLACQGNQVQFTHFPGFGHTLEAMERCFGPSLRWLLGPR